MSHDSLFEHDLLQNGIRANDFFIWAASFNPKLQMNRVFHGTPLLDAGGLDGFATFLKRCKKRKVELVLSDVQFQPLKAMVKAQIKPENGNFVVYPTLAEALDAVIDTDPEVAPVVAE